MKEKIYLDHSATTPVHPQVFSKMQPFFHELFGNPSSVHSFGQKVKLKIEDARKQIADSLNTKTSSIIFTSGGTESNYLAIVGTALANQDKGKHIIISQIEHSAVIEAVKFLSQFDFSITYLPVDKYGKVSLENLKNSIRKDTILISIMYVNNEIGTIQPIEEIGRIARERGIYFHTDAVQAYPILEIDVTNLPVDLLTISSHKINGPKGVGALYINEGVKLHSLISGTQERSIRGGTENVPAIIGFGEAAQILKENKNNKYNQALEYKNKMLSIWRNVIGEEYFNVNGHPENVVPTILNVSFFGIKTNTMIMNLDMKGIAISGGSACASGAVTTSRIIKALNIEEKAAQSAVRISFGLGNTEEQIEAVANEIVNIIKKKIK